MTINHEDREDLPPIDPCANPATDLAGWRTVALTGTCTLRLPPWLSPEPRSESETSEVPRLVSLHVSPSRAHQVNGVHSWLAAWLYARPGLSVAQYPPGHPTQVADTRTCSVAIGGRDVRVATWRARTEGDKSTYGVAACWQIAENRWIQIAAQVPTPTGQGEILAALRTIDVAATATG
jgi:hypothetical protein